MINPKTVDHPRVQNLSEIDSIDFAPATDSEVVYSTDVEEVVYSPEMDHDAKRLIQEITKLLGERPEARELKDDRKNTEDIGALKISLGNMERDLGWHAKVGWGTAVLIGGAFLWLLTSHLPEQGRQMQSAISGDIAKQLKPLEIQLAVLTAGVETSKPGASKILPKLMNENLQQKADPDLGVRIVAALADAAAEKNIEASPEDIRSVGSQLLQIYPNPNEIQWGAVTKLATYISQLPDPTVPKPQPGQLSTSALQSPFIMKDSVGPKGRLTMAVWGHLEEGAEIPFIAPIDQFDKAVEAISKLRGTTPAWILADSHSNRVLLDGMKMRRVIIKDAIVVYEGGPVDLKDVYFVNCTFEWPDGARSKQIANSLFAGAAVTVRIS